MDAAPATPLAASRPPWTVTAAALVSFTALALVGQEWLVPVLLGLALLATYVFSARLDAHAWLRWAVRLALLGPILWVNLAEPTTTRGHPRYDASVVHMVGEMLAAELVVQNWRRRPMGGTRGALTIFLSGFVFLVGCNTFNHDLVRLLAPAYLFFVLLSLRGVRERPRPGKALRPALVAACAVALVIGVLTAEGMHFYRSPLSQFAISLARPFMSPRPSVGFADDPSLGPTRDLKGTYEPVLRVQGPFPSPYLRGMAFDRYRQGRWGPSRLERRLGSIPREVLSSLAPGPRTSIARLGIGTSVLFLPLHCAGLRPPDDTETRWETSTDASLVTRGQEPCTYEVVVTDEPDHQGPLCVPPGEAYRRRCLALPDGLDARVRELAQRIAGSEGGPRERIRAVADYLRTHHAYSRTTDPGPGDPVTNFLLEKKAAHCEYFASAAVVLLRCLGVPARFVGGYYAHETHGATGYVVRQRDAHAWTEAWVDGSGWVTVEATPPSGRPDQTAEPVPLWRRAWERLSDGYSALAAWLAGATLADWGALAGAAAALVIAGFGALRWLKRRPRARVFRYATPDEAFAKLAAAFELWLARQDRPCPAHLTWEEHLAGLGRGGPRPRPAGLELAEAFVREYNAVRFGRPQDRAAVQTLWERLQALR